MEPKLTSPSVVREILADLGIRPLKRLGQNFLVDFSLRERIVAGLELLPGERVVEIGPGLGAITQGLLARSADVHAIEIDRPLAAHLRRFFGPALHVHEGDALKADLRALLGPGGKLVGNLPYYISTPLVAAVLEAEPVLAVLMLQKEVAERLRAAPGSPERGALTLFVEYAADVEPWAQAAPGQFYPQPQVSSQVVRLHPRPNAIALPWPMIRPVVSAAFRYRRKTLGKALQEGFGIGPALAANASDAAGIDARRRGETLSLQEFGRLAENLVTLGVDLAGAGPTGEPI
jgi:16S rRNA (adenine1518-N6/adenine1519-N6)-dimethyltransferase